MTNDAEKYLDADIPDPTDFKTDAPGLRQLDQALRCTMCRELFQAPVTVNCPHGHCFCSYCIRNAMMTKEECPLCRGQINEVHIRKNPAMEDAVRAWGIARPFVLQILKERADAEATAAAPAKATQIIGNTKSKKRKITPQSDSDNEIVEIEERLAPSSAGKASSLSLVSCPACNKNVPMKEINNHLDAGCPPPSSSGLISPPTPSKDKGKQKQEWSQFFDGAGARPSAKKGRGKARAPELNNEYTEPLPKVAYDTVTQKRLREILEEYGLSTAGDKNMMAARHSRYVNTVNANLDASPAQRKSVKQLQVEMRRWDEAEEKKKTRKKVDAKDFDPEEYQRENKSMFAKLVQAARARPPQKRAVSPESSPNAGKESSPAAPPTESSSPRQLSTESPSRRMMVDDDD
ncbi:uncharacterized protein PHACADRAFT_209467 [Phanerochaete carnosa HHB-10118-sp]|uniref:Postreplication repair E3 ubiquitin-protein ligase RAD18 n=1 Tax=Phanerochaete carnosa (strain HHB-10118-sp) TaxID=650164 RepID=K5V0H0_PHACS|nr:uncharacterized protein PHACADRAFT_209467 [Phanerochaete carnosa HHB-10118-sp]EKM55961.1 hypothetical protein PHACADRAFT_209467 [Phanerochaete carnosa HHB-10118-sp]